MNYIFIVLGILALGLFVERVWRLFDEPRSLTQRAILAALLAIAIGATAYGTKGALVAFFDIGNLVWHLCATALIGCLEVIFFTLRVEQVKARAIRPIAVRSLAMVALVVAAWPGRLAQQVDERQAGWATTQDLPSFVFTVIFPLYVIWGLSQGVLLSLYRIPRDIRRRPISTLAFALIAIGLTGFVLINLSSMLALNLGYGYQLSGIVSYAPLALGIAVAGAVVLAIGERAYDDLSARYHLMQLGPLWRRMTELSDQSFHLPSEEMAPPARLQRAYVEISDAMCTLRVPPKRVHDLQSLVRTLRQGACVADRTAPTLSESLPRRRTRREDLELIEALARAYRQTPSQSAAAFSQQ